MPNPILQAMRNKNSKMGNAMNILQMLQGNPASAYDQLMRTNPQFRQFVQDNKGKSPEQIAQEHGIDLKQIMNLK